MDKPSNTSHEHIDGFRIHKAKKRPKSAPNITEQLRDILKPIIYDEIGKQIRARIRIALRNCNLNN